MKEKDELIENLKLYNYHSDGKTNTMEQTFQVDYTTPIGKLHTIETGVKYIFRRNSVIISFTRQQEAAMIMHTTRTAAAITVI